MIGVIAGTGFYELPFLQDPKVEDLTNVYGTARVTRGTWHGKEVLFLTRHGASHSTPPHAVNYRANIRALADLGVTKIVAINVSGGIDDSLPAGSLALIEDFIDFTSGRASTFFDGEQPEGVKHVDMTNPYDRSIQQQLAAAARKASVELHSGATYICFDGPRFETAAEIRLAKLVGASVVGMTGYPEVALAKEAGIPYAAIALVSNPAAGLEETPISLDDIRLIIEGSSQQVLAILDRFVEDDTSR